MKIKVLHLIENLEAAGGAQRRLLSDLKLLDRNRFDNRLCYLFNANELEPQIKELDLRADCLNLKSVRDLVRGILRINKLLGEFKPDIIHTQLFTADICARFTSLLNNRVPIISTVQSSVYSSDDTFFHSPVRQFLDSLSARISRCHFIAVSEFVKKVTCKFLKVNEEMVEVIYNSIDVEEFSRVDQQKLTKLKEELGLNPDERVILSAGKLNPPKGYKHLLEAMRIIADRSPLPWKVLIAGDGPERVVLEQKASALRLKEKILFLGKRADVRELLELCDIFVLPSLSEGLPLVVLEAMASQRACIAVDIEPLREMINSGIQGLLVEPANATALAEAIIKVMEDRVLAHKFAQNGFSCVKEKFNAAKTTQELERFYERVLSKGN